MAFAEAFPVFDFLFVFVILVLLAAEDLIFFVFTIEAAKFSIVEGFGDVGFASLSSVLVEAVAAFFSLYAFISALVAILGAPFFMVTEILSLSSPVHTLASLSGLLFIPNSETPMNDALTAAEDVGMISFGRKLNVLFAAIDAVSPEAVIVFIFVGSSDVEYLIVTLVRVVVFEGCILLTFIAVGIISVYLPGVAATSGVGFATTGITTGFTTTGFITTGLGATGFGITGFGATTGLTTTAGFTIGFIATGGFTAATTGVTVFFAAGTAGVSVEKEKSVIIA
jgi:hypothetical protein